MAETVTLARVLQGELPFTLNLPDGTYPVLVCEGHSYPIDILQERIAVSDGPDVMMSGKREELQRHFGDRWDSLYKHELRTIVRHREEVYVQSESLPVPNERQVFEAAQQYLLRATPGIVPGGPEQLQLQARQLLEGLGAEDLAAFTADTRVRLAVAASFPHREIETFCAAVNVLIRLYMATFEDRFVQEISESMFSGTAFHGVHSAIFCNGQIVERTRYVGGFFPYMVRRPWLEHGAEAVANFRASLESKPHPDPVVLLGIRARSMLLRGANRSAIIEASAALDLSISRKIRAGLRLKGKTDPEVETLLRKPSNQRFDERGKKLLRDATGLSAASFDNTLWTRVVAHRTTHRQGSSHADAEPSSAEAQQVIDDFLQLAGLVDAITPS